MSAIISATKQSGSQALNAVYHLRASTASRTYLSHNLSSSRPSTKLLSTSAPSLVRRLSNDSQRRTYVDEHDPESRYAINTERNEYSKSGSDNAVAAQQSSWDIRNNTPESAKEESERESATNGRHKASPLEVSPANQDVSRFTNESGRGVPIIHGPSKRVSPKKGKKVDYGGGEPAAIESGNEATKM